jgi:hypothetical protein
LITRMTDYFADTTPWPRRLWQASSLLTLEEAAEAGTWVDNKTLSTGAVSWFLNDVQRLLGPDHGLGDSNLRREVNSLLGSGLEPRSRERRRLVQLIPLVRRNYLQRWSTALDGGEAISAERFSRIIATHLLDCGHSPGAMHGWATAWLHEDGATLSDLISSANELASLSDQQFTILVPMRALPQANLAAHLDEWLSAAQTSAWMTARGFAPVRTSGAFSYTVVAKDALAAAQLAAAQVRRLQTRRSFSRGMSKPMQPLGKVWVEGRNEPLELQPVQRGVTVLALERERIMYSNDKAAGERLDEALELAGALNSGPASAAVAGAWAAIESLLVRPDDRGDKADGRAIAADRLAAIVACSWPRAELTSLAHRYQPVSSSDSLFDSLSACETNLQRCELMAGVLRDAPSGSLPRYASHSDQAAAARMRTVLQDSRTQINDVARILRSAFRRLYRQRNVVVHSGSTESIGLDPSLRVAAPLFGAGLDRLLHAQLTEQLEPLELAARAENSLALVDDLYGPSPTMLLEKSAR